MQQPPRAPPAEPTAAKRARHRDLFQPDTPSPESSVVSSWEDLHSGISAPPLNNLSPGKRFNLLKCLLKIHGPDNTSKVSVLATVLVLGVFRHGLGLWIGLGHGLVYGVSLVLVSVSVSVSFSTSVSISVSISVSVAVSVSVRSWSPSWS